MLAEISHGRSQALLRQRNMLLLSSLTLLVIALWLVFAVTTKDREIVLAPIVSRPLTLSSAGVTADYLEFVTRDVAYLALNRSPAALDYWMEEVLALVHPAAYGRVKAELLKLATEQRGSDVSQAFTITGMTVDPARLTSDVTGELKTFVGRQIVADEKRTYRFSWNYTGLRLSLVRFAAVQSDTKGGAR